MPMGRARRAPSIELAADPHTVMVAPFGAAPLLTIPAVMTPAVVPPVVMAAITPVVALLVAPAIAVAVIALRIGTGAGADCSGEQPCSNDDPGDRHVMSFRPEIGHDAAVGV